MALGAYKICSWPLGLVGRRFLTPAIQDRSEHQDEEGWLERWRLVICGDMLLMHNALALLPQHVNQACGMDGCGEAEQLGALI